MCACLLASTERGVSPKGCQKGPGSMSHLGEAFSSVAAGGSFTTGACLGFVLSSHLGSFSTLAISDPLCPRAGLTLHQWSICLFDGPSALRLRGPTTSLKTSPSHLSARCKLSRTAQRHWLGQSLLEAPLWEDVLGGKEMMVLLGCSLSW